MGESLCHTPIFKDRIGVMAGKVLYIDCFSGVAGDMFVGALLDLGAGSDESLRTELEKLDLEGWSLSSESVRVNGMRARKFTVTVSGGHEEPRDLGEIEKLIDGSGLPKGIRGNAIEVFRTLAVAEAAAHGEPLGAVRFHEVGMVDSIIDIVGACILMRELAPARVIASPVALGSGTVDTMHGMMPVPAPATVNLLKGAPVVPGEAGQELATPTGAALLTHFADGFGPLPAMVFEKSGYGAGSRKTAAPNFLRMMLGRGVGEDSGAEVENLLLLETSIDDSTPEQLAYVAEKLIAAGAVDAWLSPVIMKKGRPGVVLSALSAYGDSETMLDIIFAETSTFGIRARGVERYCLERRVETVDTSYGAVRVKTGMRNGVVVTVSPEYEDCRRLAEENGVPLKKVYEAALGAFSR